MRIARTLLAALLFSQPAPLLAQEPLSFKTQDGALIAAEAYGKGERGVLLAHGGRFTKESWRKQATVLADAGFRVLAIDLRGFGQSRAPEGGPSVEQGGRLDVLAAVEQLRKGGAKTVSVVGGSMGGDYAAEAAEADPRAIDRLVLLAAGAYTTLSKMKGPKLFIMAKDDVMGENTPRLPRIRAQFEKAAEPKEFVLLEGSAHAQFLFATDQGERVMKEILRFLTAP
jgi:pimeloyl-ACP methyl ester carboxylesterase